MFFTYSNITLLPSGAGMTKYVVRINLDKEISPLFPYIKGDTRKAVSNEKPPFIRFVLDRYLCILHPQNAMMAPVADMKEGVSAMEMLIRYIDDIHSRRNEIIPDFTYNRHQPVLEIYRLLPRTNCGRCGFESCMAFAVAVSLRNCLPEQCPSIESPIYEKAVYPVRDSEGNLLSMVEIDINAESHGNRAGGKIQGDMRDKMRMKPREDQTAGKRSPDSMPGIPEPLSMRQLEILKLISEGYSNREISALLAISANTVKSHVTHIFNKLGVNDRTQASVLAIRQKLI